MHFFKENQKVDKKIMGEYIGNRNNGKVLDAFVWYVVFIFSQKLVVLRQLQPLGWSKQRSLTTQIIQKTEFKQSQLKKFFFNRL